MPMAFSASPRRNSAPGKYQSIEVKPTYGLTDEQVEQMILESFEYAEADIEARQVIEARNEAGTRSQCDRKGICEDESSRTLPAEEQDGDHRMLSDHLREAMKSDRPSRDP